MLLPAVVEQQAKLGVSAEESKTQRLKRQQARFRDRGGAFVPSETNPLVDILLARTVSGESPSKLRQKDVTVKRCSPSKACQASPIRKANTTIATDKIQPVAGNSKPKPATSRKRKAKVVEPEADVANDPPKRRGRAAKGKEKVSNADSDAEQLPPPNTTSKINCRQRNAVPSSRGKPKPKAKAKSSTTKKVVEALVSDDDQTLVEVPHKAKSDPRRDAQNQDDTPLVKKWTSLHVPAKDSGMNIATTVKIEKIPGVRDPGKKTSEDAQKRVHDKKPSETDARKHSTPPDDGGSDVVPPTKKRKAAKVAPVKPNKTTEPEVTGKTKGKGKAEPDQNVTKALGHELAPGRTAKSKKRKKQEDNHDDRPWKAVKLSEPGPPHSSSRKLKENRSKSTKEDRVHETQSKPVTKLPKGPPPEILARIKASVAQHLRCADSEPDELDCLS